LNQRILSLQRHKLRSEHWLLLQAWVAIVDGKKNLYAREAHWIFPKIKTPRPESSDENLIIIEVQTGEYYGDDDIERLEDKYGRFNRRIETKT